MFKKLFTSLAASAFALSVCGVTMVGCEEDTELEDAAEDIEDSAEDTGEDIEEGAEDLGDDVEDGLDD